MIARTLHASTGKWLLVGFWLSLAAYCVFGSGCRRAEISPQAQPWPLAVEDPRETEGEPGTWPMFRGPNAQGIGIKANPPVVFGEDKNFRWRVAVPGQGNSSPVVWHDRIFLTTAEGDRGNPVGVVLAYRRSDGSLLWRYEVGKLSGRTHSKNGYASPSVACDGERIVAYFGSAGLFCLDLDGNLLWRKDLGPQEHEYGVGSSPVIVGNIVIQLCDREQDSFLIALNKNTGDELWRTPRPTVGCWTTPVIVPGGSEKGASILLVNGGSTGSAGRVAAYDSANGRELWHRDEAETEVTPVAVFAARTLISMSGRNGPVIALSLSEKGIDGAPQLLWKLPRGGPYIPSGLLYRNRLYIVADSRNLACYNPGNGSLIWRTNLNGTFTSSLVAAAGRIYAVNERGTVFVFNAGDEFRLLAENRIGGRCLATPAIVENDLILRTDGFLYCFAEESDLPRGRLSPSKDGEKGPENANDLAPEVSEVDKREDGEKEIVGHLESGSTEWPVFRGTPEASGFVFAEIGSDLKRKWIFTAENDQFTATPIIAENTVYLGGAEGVFYALALNDGVLRWKSPGYSGFAAPAGYWNGRVYVGDLDGKFHCLKASDGERLWQVETGAEIDGGPSFVTLPSGKTGVIVGSQDSYLYCLDAVTGEIVWKATTQDQIRCTPPVIDGRTFVAGCDGKLHVLALNDGRQLAAVDLGGPTGSTPALVNRWAYVGTEGGVFYGIDWQKSQVVWKFEDAKGGDAFRSSAAVNERYVVVGSRDRKVHCLDRITGEHRWEFPTRRYVDASPLIVRKNPDQDPNDDLVIAASLDGHLYGIRIGPGEKVFDIPVGGSISASPIVIGGHLIIATEDGDVCCFVSAD
ncbi:MAG: outer membrane protein assembly factor BamB family protein [Thermogutta sp.]